MTRISGFLCVYLCVVRIVWLINWIFVRIRLGHSYPGIVRRHRRKGTSRCGVDPRQLRDLGVQRQRRDVGVDLGCQVGVGVAEDFLGDALIDAVANAERLPRFPEGMEMNRPAERIDALDARTFEVAAQNVVRRLAKPEDGFAERARFVGFRPHRLQLLDDLRPERHSSLVLVLRRALAKQRIGLRFVPVQVGPHERPHLALPLAV